MKYLIHPNGLNPQIKVGPFTQIAFNQYTNRIYIWKPYNCTVAVIDSNSGATKYIHVEKPSSCPGTVKASGYMLVNTKTNKIYVAYVGHLFVIEGYNNRIRQIPVGGSPSFMLLSYGSEGNKIYVANVDSVSVIDSYSDSKIKQIQIPLAGHPVLMTQSSAACRLPQYPPAAIRFT